VPGMRPGAITPEELESLLEDGFVLGDRHALAELFEAGAVLCAGPGPAAVEARGREQIARAVGALCERGYSYLADPQRVLQARRYGPGGRPASDQCDAPRRRPQVALRGGVPARRRRGRRKQPMTHRTSQALAAAAVSSAEREPRWRPGPFGEITATAAIPAQTQPPARRENTCTPTARIPRSASSATTWRSPARASWRSTRDGAIV
jgi:hypothetical protein